MRAFTLTTLVTDLALFAGAVTPAAAADAAVGNLPMPVEQIIDNFIAKETEFAGARSNYTYRQTVKILEYTDSGRVRVKYEIVQDIIFGGDGRRNERVVFAPVSTLQNIILTPQDMQDLRDVQPFVMTTVERNDYHIRYLGPEKVDEIECYTFAVKPKQLEKGKRYFEGQIWVDQLDLQIVKTYGKGVGKLKKNEVYISPERKSALIDAGAWEDPVLRKKYLRRYAEYDRKNGKQ